MSRHTRIHIGNISPKLAESPDNLTKRLSKFGDVVSPLELHSKPLNDHYYGFITLDIAPKNLHTLLTSLNNVLFMGMKLNVNTAKPSFQDQWKKDSERQVPFASKDKVQAQRQTRISEYTCNYHKNPVTNTLTTMCPSTGYSVSAHVFMDKAANTKNSSPSLTLVGSKSYGSLTRPTKFYEQRHAMIAGGGEVIRGRIRKTPRTKEKAKAQSLRILINGNLKSIKAYKTKLWGYEKHKTASDLTWYYDNGVWKGGDDHVIERVDFKCGINGAQAMDYGKQLDMAPEPSDGSQTASENQEKQKALSVLASMFVHHDFDKPTELEDDEEEVVVDSKGRKKAVRFDYETEGTVLNVEHSDSDKEDTLYVADIIEEFKSQAQIPSPEVYYDESDEGNELDFDTLGRQYSTENMAHQYLESHKEKEDIEDEDKDDDEAHKDDSSEEEFIPTFGSAPPKSNTEALRSLLNPQESSGFSLGLAQDDIDTSKQVDVAEQQQVLKSIKSKQKEHHQQQDEVSEPTSSRFGLFWMHTESPFLQTQTQLSKLGYVSEKVKLPGEDDEQIGSTNPEEETPYEKWFWNTRGEVSRECKRRKRDVLRVLKKKSGKNFVV
ncbi:hypothetical protein CANTEDRAFT_119970 [Yamadazyma tenuis ATCC 10573]|uniref:RRM domain-containing protein n=1 Tax=Candida tenuis (strain ATCC 10573 / BCRC 21748 / CBS 615 / JCM 9827 / NBRC 10315 / NRRL Y-1498 / VKM Y-70) TaxID=590646 RepID=G3B1L8_CANTC|nr:uncharacterized protein CANTEDRAFT_119970 [Yamadazyma tenuis ATCC 10573]EGV64477.1 hypothetical protein CANTEDRAFT_119970 [Yamadazyma tenuis ATCC 10573]